MRDHPDSELLERFMRGEASALERRSIVRHMLAGCPRCLEVTRPLWCFGALPLLPLEQAEDEEDDEEGPAVEARRAGSRLTR